MSRHHILKNRSGEGTPMVIAIVLALIILFCAVSEFSRVWLIVQGVEEAARQAVIGAANDNYDDVYHAVREGYAAGWYPEDGGWTESVDTGDIYDRLSGTIGAEYESGRYVKYADGQVEFAVSDLDVEVRNNGLGSGLSEGYTALAELKLEVPIRFAGNILTPLKLTLHVEAKYVPLF